MLTLYDEPLRSLAPSGRSPAGSCSGSTTSSGRCGGYPLIGRPGARQLLWPGEPSSATMGVEASIGVRLPMAASPSQPASSRYSRWASSCYEVYGYEAQLFEEELSEALRALPAMSFVQFPRGL